jgi:3-phenylpropionate/cinnamic acid dioxygenase small subunit
MNQTATPFTQQAVEQLLYREAQLLDRHQLEQWLSLYTDDATYWVPLEMGQVDPINTSSIIYDDRTLMEIRVKQYLHPRAHARVPQHRTCHQVSNVLPAPATGGSNALEQHISSTLVVVEFRQERQRVWGATVEHRLRATDEGLRIVSKRVDLVNSESDLDGIAFIF